MENHLYKILGVVLMGLSGLFHTCERIAARISSALVYAGYASHMNGVSTNSPDYPHIFDNFFVWFLFLVGFILLVFGFPKRT